ncbi:sulfite exporter TauE/SafE family protein [Pseudorhodoferax sp. Leaf274]|uniref:sulfite exporter TauE/SafE family protein n=1 Tax=Pseudorhodoferax sp. Leaf274 TaxID=1736318 RepID=UPI000B02C312|nr:sulfite exporter TauE/SafE family protein [Pseudorhodoferax sp. Leaf274]
MALSQSLAQSPFVLPALVAGVFLLAGLVKGVVGMGLPTVALGLLALWMAPAEAAALLIVPSLATNLWQMQPWGRLLPMLRRLWPMQLGVVAGTVGGAWCFGALAGAWAPVALGLALVAYALWSLAGLRLAVAPGAEPVLGPLVGGITGLVTAATGVFVLPAVPYLQALRWSSDELIQAMGISFTVSTLALAIGLRLGDGSAEMAWGLSLGMLVPALAGMALGAGLRRRLSPAVFRRCFLAGLLVLGAHMVLRELLR